MVSLLLLSFSSFAQPKTIRLRNEVITTFPNTNHGANAVQTLAVPIRVDGLFLVQFEGYPEAAQRAGLRSMGVELVKYVPEDAFIAKLSQVSLEQLRAVSFVRWVGPYRPEHKISPRLTAAAGPARLANRSIPVSLLLSAAADQKEIDEVRGLLSSVAHESHLRQGVVLQGQVAPGLVDSLAQSGAVLWLEPAPKRKLVDEQASKLVGGDDGNTATPTVTQQHGFAGQGVTVCVADTGLDTGITNTMHPDLRGRVTGFKYYGSIGDGSDGYGHGTHAAGIVAGNAATGETDPDTGTWYGLGVASGANLFIERIFDEYAGMADPFPSDEELTRDAVRNGAQIGSNSWGDDVYGDYNTDAAQFDELVRDADALTPGDQPYILEFSAGNVGPDSETMDSPATGKNVISTGACENSANMPSMTYGLYGEGPDTVADFSSRGPCLDGRIKPDLVAPGTWIASLASSQAPGEASIAWSPIDDYYVYMGGTSMAGPHAAGAAAVFVQYYRSLHTNATPSPALVKAALINSATPLDDANGGPGPIPNNDEGWGRITLENVIFTNLLTAPRYYEYVDQSVLLSDSQVYVRHALVQNSDQPLKITLAYTDVAGFPGATPALVNDLDLEVVGPDGTLYRGNRFSAGESLPNPPSPDSLNNVEAVHLSQPKPGDYQVRIRARHVVEDARQDTAAIDQDFALVVSGNLARPGTGTLILDRAFYTAPSAVRLSVFDVARGSSNGVSVLVKSTTEPAGETILLPAAGAYGAFTGAVATVVGVAKTDGMLQVHDGDAIEATYVDSSGAKRVAAATVNLTVPVLSGVSVIQDLGVTTIGWQSSVPADSVVRYSTDSSFNLAASDTTLGTSHSIRLTRLAAGQRYYFYVTSTDAAGNTGANNNAGAYYTFVAGRTPTVLLVDDYDNFGEEAAGSPVIPDGAYTNALAAAGYSFAFWKVIQRGSPQLEDLLPFPVVIWRTTDDIVNYGVTEDGLPDPTATHNTLTPQQQLMIQTYLNKGGSFFMASMGILSQLGDVAFRRETLQVARFKLNPDPPSPCADCDEYFGVPAILGAAGDPVAGGISTPLDYSAYPSFSLDFGGGDYTLYGPDFGDTFTPTTNAIPILFEPTSGKVCGMRYPSVGVDSPGRVVFLSFPIDTVASSSSSPNNIVALLGNILKFLAPGADGVGAVSLNSGSYTVPDLVTIEIGDADLVGKGVAQAVFSTSSSTNEITVILNETTHPGLFRGYLSLVADNGTTNRLVVRNGDTIAARYYDDSNRSNVIASATVDAVPPTLSEVKATTRYGDAQVTWLSSKPADSLVQYGQSVLLDRTAYVGTLTTNHAVTISGLAASRDYYYLVVSRDEAGNTVVDDNQGALYRFTTRQAPQPPWSDDLESGASDWVVMADPVGSDENWTLGTPNNGLQTKAHSGTHAWGSDLNGQQFNLFASSMLVSPIINLSGFSKATLTFWDCFDFSPGSLGIPFEQGEILISTNSSANATQLQQARVLADFTGVSSLDWEEETLDLTPFVGQTIQVVWWYQGVSIGDPVYGWLIDDISITGTAAGQGGTITISANLNQASFTLTGPIGRSGTGVLTTLTNAPLGDYTIKFGDVSFYQTPGAQSGVLTKAGATLSFTGDYTFIDANRNGISDSWERFYFGGVSTNRTQLTDTDGDGMPDYAEFIAGTDPTNAASKFVFLADPVLTNHVAKLQWASVRGRSYQVQTSADLRIWTPLTDWLPAPAASPMIYNVTNTGAASRLYRIQVRP